MTKENVSVEISMPLIDDIELQSIDIFYNDIVSEYTKAFVKEKDQVIAQRLMMNLQQENKQLKEQLLITQTNEETFRLEMEDITQTLGLDEDTIFDDVKTYARSLKDNWNKLKVYIKTEIPEDVFIDTEWFVSILDKMKELEQGSDSNE